MFFNNYTKPGKGVNKRDPNQPRIVTFFEILPRKFWDLCKLNLLYMITIIPFFIVTMLITGVLSSQFINALSASPAATEVQSFLALYDVILRFAFAFCFAVLWGQGPLTAGFTYIVRNYGREEHCWLFSDYFERTKSNFKQGILMWIIDLAAFYIISVAIVFYLRSSFYIPVVFLFFILIAYTLMHMYIYQIMITFELPLKHILKNSMFFAFGNAAKNFLLFLIQVLVHMVIPIAAILYLGNLLTVLIVVLLELLILPALTAFTVNFFVYSSLEIYIKQANEESENDTETE